MTAAIDRVSTVLGDLAFAGAEFIYCHASLKDLGLSVDDARALVDRIRWANRGPCTLVIPSFPFGENVEYAAYVSRPELDFDVVRTPARVNLFGEIFRRRPEARRSLHPIMTVCADGPKADDLIAESHLDELPFGPRSVFQRMAVRKTCVLGLGVNFNTGSFIHAVDDAFADQFPYPLYSEKPIACRLLRDGMYVGTRVYRAITPDVRRSIKPIRLHALIQGKPFYRFVDGPMPFYGLDVQPFMEFGRSLAASAFNDGGLPVWHQPRV